MASFESSEDEVAFWKAKAQQYQEEAKAAREELDEYQESSRELEAELETQLEQAEGKMKEYRSMANRLQLENETIKDKLEQCQREYHCQVTELQTELSEIKDIRERLNKYIRDLEQQNDDLERAKRSTLASLEDFEDRMNKAIERNAFLESELDEKEALKGAVQRMKDETRDLKAELRILAPRHPNLSLQESLDLQMPDNDKKLEANNNSSGSKALPDSNKLAADCETKSEAGSETQQSSAASSTSTLQKQQSLGGCEPPPGGSFAPSARISALNIVGDLLRKVGALEMKLVSCRNIVKEGGPSSASATPTGTPNGMGGSGDNTPTRGGFVMDRSKRIPRGSSTPSIKKIIDSS